jgi:hypothetical protein
MARASRGPFNHRTRYTQQKRHTNFLWPRVSEADFEFTSDPPVRETSLLDMTRNPQCSEASYAARNKYHLLFWDLLRFQGSVIEGLVGYKGYSRLCRKC